MDPWDSIEWAKPDGDGWTTAYEEYFIFGPTR